jgi:hypothetical protein
VAFLRWRDNEVAAGRLTTSPGSIAHEDAPMTDSNKIVPPQTIHPSAMMRLKENLLDRCAYAKSMPLTFRRGADGFGRVAAKQAIDRPADGG